MSVILKQVQDDDTGPMPEHLSPRHPANR
jgi:hypothetical protein